jgi:hypothetical protein
VTWPSKFRPILPSKYDGSSDPVVFLHVYSTAMGCCGGGRQDHG